MTTEQELMECLAEALRDSVCGDPMRMSEIPALVAYDAYKNQHSSCVVDPYIPRKSSADGHDEDCPCYISRAKLRGWVAHEYHCTCGKREVKESL